MNWGSILYSDEYIPRLKCSGNPSRAATVHIQLGGQGLGSNSFINQLGGSLAGGAAGGDVSGPFAVGGGLGNGPGAGLNWTSYGYWLADAGEPDAGCGRFPPNFGGGAVFGGTGGGAWFAALFTLAAAGGLADDVGGTWANALNFCTKFGRPPEGNMGIGFAHDIFLSG